MPGVTRKETDLAGANLIQGSPDVFVNNKAAVRKDDAVAGHIGLAPHDGPIMIQGSGTVFVNGKPLCRAGDIANCGHPATGSDNVFAGD
jgi:uncharacterized Zn-binding protein involved in type VI secretion